MNQLTEQQIFDNALRTVLAQGGKSVGASGECLYRAPGGRKCAIGASIPDELYLPVMDSAHPTGIARWLGRGQWLSNDTSPPQDVHAACDVFYGLFGAVHSGFLQQLQYAHDEYAPDEHADHHPEEAWLGQFLRKMQKIAWQFGLSFDPASAEATE